MRLKNILLVVSDIERARHFYQELFGLCVLRDFGENVMLTEGVVLQEKKSWEQLIGTDTVTGNASELFFEENNFDEFLHYLEDHPEVEKAGAVRVNSWGKRVLMLKDPDGHLIEVAER